ncbi:MAG: hypothetical protein WA578_13110 [Candidatus Sulfotelmatobacter sp.]
MHRPLLIAAFVLLLAAVPVAAQHGGGGHASGGGQGGFASHGGFAGHSSAPAFGGARVGSGSAARSFAPRSASRPAFSNRGSNRYGRTRFGAYGVGGNCYYYGYGCVGGYGYPWGYAGEIDPYWWWDSDSGSSYDPDQQYQTGLANEMNEQSLDEQRMRQQNDQDLYAQWAPSPPREHSEHAELNEAAPATVLVFRDEHKQEVKNYAIVGQMLWDFDLQHTQKIPLSDLDLPATAKANDARGVDFQLPGASEGQ